jgi:hypothetical protein
VALGRPPSPRSCGNRRRRYSKNSSADDARAGAGSSPKADVFQSVLDAVTELMAGEVGEGMFFDEPCFASDDRRQAMELASLICRSSEAVDHFLRFCERQALDLLAEHVTALMSLQIILRMYRTMSGRELDETIASVQAHQAVARERLRWK